MLLGKENSSPFVLVKAEEREDLEKLCGRIRARTGLAAYTAQQFKDLTYDFYMKNTGIPINFGIAVALGFLVGTAIAGQTFYNFTVKIYPLRHITGDPSREGISHYYPDILPLHGAWSITPIFSPTRWSALKRTPQRG